MSQDRESLYYSPTVIDNDFIEEVLADTFPAAYVEGLFESGRHAGKITRQLFKETVPVADGPALTDETYYELLEEHGESSTIEFSMGFQLGFFGSDTDKQGDGNE